MGALELTREEYTEGLEKISKVLETGHSYLDQFKIKFLEGLNTASSLEICRLMQDPSLEAKVNIMKICVAGKTVEVTCPNGDVEKFMINNPTDSLEALPLFQKEPLALSAIADCVYGYILKKSLRLSTAQEPAAETSVKA